MHGNAVVLLPTALNVDAAQVEEYVKHSEPQVASLRVLRGGDLAALVQAEAPASIDSIVAINRETELISTELHALVLKLASGGSLHYYAFCASEENKGAVLMALMINGMVDTSEVAIPSSSPFLAAGSGVVRFDAKKPAFDSQSRAAISLKKTTDAPKKASLPLKKWTIVADEEDELIDEDTLLDDTDEVLKAAKDDCGVGVGGKKRACKNCTCGRKDMEDDDKPVVSDKELSQMVSSCGNCFKGDAFRCGGCPFLGKPAFKPGMEKVMLNLDDADDL